MLRVACFGLILVAAALASAAAAQEPLAQEPAEKIAGVLPARAAEPQPRVRADALARTLGASLAEEDGVLVLRRDGATATMFDGSDEVLLAGAAALSDTLSAPARREPDGWWLPLDAGAPLGLVRVDARHVRAPDGRLWLLEVEAQAVRAVSPRAEIIATAAGSRGVQLFAPGPDGGADAVALWVSDLASAALLSPSAREALDAAVAEAGEGRALLLVGTSLVPDAALAAPEVHVGGRRVLAGGDRVRTVSGAQDAVGPDRPWIAVAWLPAGVRTDRSLRVSWHGVEVEVAFRD